MCHLFQSHKIFDYPVEILFPPFQTAYFHFTFSTSLISLFFVDLIFFALRNAVVFLLFETGGFQDLASAMFLIAKIVRGRRLLHELEQQEKDEAAANADNLQVIQK